MTLTTTVASDARRNRRGPPLAALVVAACALAWAGPALAQEAPAQEERRPVLPATPDFLFREPRSEAGVRLGWLTARTNSNWYDFVTDQLTLERSDFNAMSVAADAAVWLPARTAVTFGVEVTHASAPSEYRRLVDNNRQAIEQQTQLIGVYLTGGLKYALAPRGRSVGTLAWVPHRVVPYVTAGGGAAYYRLRQTGDFVDFTDRSVFSSVFESQGWAPTVYAGGGVDVRITRRMLVTGDVRYRRAAAELERAWVDFDPLDLSGLQATAGVRWIF